MALKDHGAVKAGAFDRLPVDDDRAIARLVEARQNVQHRGLATAGVANHAAELAARHRQPEIFEHRNRTAIGARIAFCNALDGNELVGHCIRSPDTFLTLPWRGRVERPKADRGGVNGSAQKSPPPVALRRARALPSAPTSPLQGEVKCACGSLILISLTPGT